MTECVSAWVCGVDLLGSFLCGFGYFMGNVAAGLSGMLWLLRGCYDTGFGVLGFWGEFGGSGFDLWRFGLGLWVWIWRILSVRLWVLLAVWEWFA